jgi:alcohol dehydrogenase
MISVQFEQEAIDNLKNDLVLLNAEKVFLVTGKKSYTDSGAKELIESLKGFFKFVRFNDFEDNPNIVDVEKGVQLFKENACDCILAIGGGSSIDMAKLIKFFTPKSKPFIGKFNNQLEENENIPLVAIPTTAGTGSEATHFAVLYVGLDKYSISDKLLLPNHIAIISKLHFSQTQYQKAVSGLDAFSQAIESFWSVNSTHQSREYSLQALKLIIPSLPKVVYGAENIDEYKKMAVGAYLAGKAINIAKTTAPHAFSYYLTKRFNLPHGHAVAFFLPSFISYNFYLNSAESNLSNNSNLENLKQVLLEYLPKNNLSLDKSISLYISSLGIQLNLIELKISKEEISLSLSSGNKERLKNNPRVFEYELFIKETNILNS